MTDLPQMTAEQAVAAQKVLVALVEGRCPTCGAAGTKEQASLQPEGPVMPDGYQIVKAAKTTRYNVRKLVAGGAWPALTANCGRPKRFHTQEKAALYARKHSALQLNADQKVPGWV
jgi:hypothetical protein